MYEKISHKTFYGDFLLTIFPAADDENPSDRLLTLNEGYDEDEL